MTTSDSSTGIGLPVATQCAACDRWFSAPQQRCPGSHEHRPVPVTLSGIGTVFSLTVTHVAMTASARQRVPYATALVEFTEGPRMAAHVAGPPDALEIGARVRVEALTEPASDHLPAGALLAHPLPVDRAARGTM